MNSRAARIILFVLIADVHLLVQKVECESTSKYSPRRILTNVNSNGRAQFKRYRDVLQISQIPKLKRRIAFDEDENSPFADQWDQLKDQKYIFSRKSKSSQTKTGSMYDGNSNKNAKSSGNPVVYRYFGRNRARSVRAESIPFIVLCSCVDHWKVVGKILASRGFSMIAIERSKRSESNVDSSTNIIDNGSSYSEDTTVQSNETCEAEALVSSVLQALKWQKAILVGCDQETVLALEAALRLPDRIVGLVMWGDLSSIIQHAHNEMKELKLSKDDSFLDTETFLEEFVDCPCQFVCDGDITRYRASAMVKTLLGGGIVPHRRLPEQLTWILTRFVEQKVSILSPQSEDYETANKIAADPDIGIGKDKRGNQQHFAPGMFLVCGRAFATILIYMSIARVSIFQYKNIRDIQFDFSTILDLSKWKIVRNGMEKLKHVRLKNKLPLYYFNKVIQRIKLNSDENSKKDLNSLKEEDSNAEDGGINSKESDKSFEKENKDEKELDRKDSENEDSTSPLLQKLLFLDQVIS